MNVKKPKSKSVPKPPYRKANGRRVSLAAQVDQLRRELREVKSQRDCFAREIARFMRPEIDDLLGKAGGDLRKFPNEKPTVIELLEELADGARR
jgi:hypothetical protein